MRAVLQSAFTVTTGLGNILVALIEATLSEVLEKVCFKLVVTPGMY